MKTLLLTLLLIFTIACSENSTNPIVDKKPEPTLYDNFTKEHLEGLPFNMLYYPVAKKILDSLPYYGLPTWAKDEIVKVNPKNMVDVTVFVLPITSTTFPYITSINVDTTIYKNYITSKTVVYNDKFLLTLQIYE